MKSCIPYALLVALGVATFAARASAAELTTGSIAGIVRASGGAPVAGARVSAQSASGRYETTTGSAGRFTIYGVSPDTYSIAVTATGYLQTQSVAAVLPGERTAVAFTLQAKLRTIAVARAVMHAFIPGSTSDTFVVSGSTARAEDPTENASGLATYTQNTVQGAIAGVPGVLLDSFANAILRGGQVSDTVFTFDSVPIPQGLIVEPGGNIAGAQLFVAGAGETAVTMAGYTTQGDNALGGIVNVIPATGTYPAEGFFDLTNGVEARDHALSFERLWATPDMRWRYAVAGSSSSEDLEYGDGSTFYPGEAGTYGVGLSSRAESDLTANVHFRPDPSDDVALVALSAQATYDEYGTPFTGETYGFLNGSVTGFPGPPNAQVTTPSATRGTYGLVKLEWMHTTAHSVARLQAYQSEYSAVAQGAFWDDDAYPDGSISLLMQQGGRVTGIGYDVDDAATARSDLYYGADVRTTTSRLNEVVPTADEYVTSQPTLQSMLAYLGERWTIVPHVQLATTLRDLRVHIVPDDGTPYDDEALDPHVAAAYSFGDSFALRATFDHTSVAPEPTEVDFRDTSNPAFFNPLAPEKGSEVTYSFESGGPTEMRATYYAILDRNVVGLLPANYHDVVASGVSPSAIGLPTNLGELRSRGFEIWVHRGGLTFAADTQRTYSSTALQFAYNGLNLPAEQAGHLFPNGYLPDATASLSYDLHAGRRLQIVPSLSYESGYPYGVGTKIWVDGPHGTPVEVDNDNYYNPGYNYYFLKNPAMPFNAVTNPYIATLGTPEGADPNSLRTPPQMLAGLHVELALSSHVTLIVDGANLLGVDTPTQLTSNPYLIGPPGYAGGNPYYEAWYGQNDVGVPYTLGNGVPTNDGEHQTLPWTYGRGGYMPMSYPTARAVEVRLRYSEQASASR